MRFPWKKAPPDDPAELQVLMVCMGNICRSPTAEGVLRHKLRAAGLDGRVRVDSAGTLGHHVGEPPDPRAQRYALRRGIDLSALRARRVTADDFQRFQLVLGMDQDNLAVLERLRPAGVGEAPGLLMTYAARHPGHDEVPDPYYGGPDGFERVLDLIDDACDGLLAHIQQRLDRARAASEGTS